MSFAFNFDGDDIDADDIEHTEPALDHDGAGQDGSAAAPAAPVESHTLEDLLSTLPSRISYTTTTIESPTGRILHLPRRELFDVRQQLMAEDDDATLANLDASDLRSNVYEGGFKTWECSLDLASLLLDRGPRKDIDELSRVDSVIELGAGSAIPTLTLFQHALQNNYAIAFTLADYNATVLRHVTLPNLLLTFARFSSNPIIPLTGSEDLEVTPEVITAFSETLKSIGITFTFISGSWSPQLASLIPPSAPDMGTLILAAETIYSPSSTEAFVALMVQILRRTHMSKAVIAAKRIYFGVGGSVDGLKEACRDQGALAHEVENSGVAGMDVGVGRALIEVQMY